MKLTLREYKTIIKILLQSYKTGGNLKLTLRKCKTIIKILLQSYKTGGNLKLTLRKCKTIIKMTGGGLMSTWREHKTI